MNDSKWLIDLLDSYKEVLDFYHNAGENQNDSLLIKARKVLNNALEVLDVGECDSGGDYHSSALGKHVDPNDGGKSQCPACAIRKMLQE